VTSLLGLRPGFAPVSSIDRLLAEPHRYSFFQAVRLLEHWFIAQEGLSADTVLSQRLRFRNSLSLSFPASEIAEFTVVRKDGDAALFTGSKGIAHIDITPAFIGLLGGSGTLPAFYTELIASRELYQRDKAARAFFDIFLQRAVVLLYQAWRKHRLPLQFESNRRQHFQPMVLSLAGLGHKALRDRLLPQKGGVSDDTLAFFAGALRHRPIAASMMQRILGQYFGVGVNLQSFIGRWFALPVEHQSTLGMGNVALGQGAVVGERVWQRDLRMRLTLGPMRRSKLERFLPGGTGALALKELLTLMTGVTIEYEVRLQLMAAEVQGAELSDSSGPRLGWNSFLVTQPLNQDRADAGYDIHAAA
jgi:type VI secretion system protein ImpH